MSWCGEGRSRMTQVSSLITVRQSHFLRWCHFLRWGKTEKKKKTVSRMKIKSSALTMVCLRSHGDIKWRGQTGRLTMS